MKSKEELQAMLNKLKEESAIAQKMLDELDHKREILNNALSKTNEAVQRIEEQLNTDE